MAGEARSDAFMLGTATVMLGPVADLMKLGPANSIGLVKNVAMKTTPGFTELTQGVKNTLVASVMTSNQTMLDAEMFEYTGRNLTYALGLDGSTVVPTTVASTVLTAIVDPTGTAESAKALVLAAGGGTTFTANDTIMIQVGTGDNVQIRKVVSKSSDTLTLDYGFWVTGVPVGATVRKVNVLAVGSLDDQPYLAAKIVGTMANGDEVVILLPKVRVSSGLSMAFKTDNFDNIPLQLSIYDLTTSDPFYAYFQSVGPTGGPAKAMLLSTK